MMSFSIGTLAIILVFVYLLGIATTPFFLYIVLKRPTHLGKRKPPE